MWFLILASDSLGLVDSKEMIAYSPSIPEEKEEMICILTCTTLY